MGLGINEFGRTCAPTEMRARDPFQPRDLGFDLLLSGSVYKRRRRRRPEGLLALDRHTWYVASGDRIHFQCVSTRSSRQRVSSPTYH